MDLNWTTPLREGKSLALVMAVRLALKRHGRVTIGTHNVDTMYKCLTEHYPNAKITKGKFCVMVEE